MMSKRTALFIRNPDFPRLVPGRFYDESMSVVPGVYSGIVTSRWVKTRVETKTHLSALC